MEALDRIVSTAQFELEGYDVVVRALEEFRLGPGDFADYLLGRSHQKGGCDVTATFDRKLDGYDAFERLGR